MTNTANVQPGESVAVFGAGGVGLCAIQAAANVGAGMIIAVHLDPAKLDFARDFGATHCVNVSTSDAVQAVRELSDGGVDYAFDAIGVAQTMSQILLATRGNDWGVGPGGTAVLVGVPQGPATIDARQLLVGERICGVVQAGKAAAGQAGYATLTPGPDLACRELPVSSLRAHAFRHSRRQKACPSRRQRAYRVGCRLRLSGPIMVLRVQRVIGGTT